MVISHNQPSERMSGKHVSLEFERHRNAAHRSTRRSPIISMKPTSALFTLALALFASTPCPCASLEGKIIRKMGTYLLDDQGSTLTIAKGARGSLSLDVSWRSDNLASTATPNECLKAEGWFVFIESRDSIWIYDGNKGGVRLVHSKKSTRVSSFSPTLKESCHQKVWDALPARFKNQPAKGEPFDSPNDVLATPVGNSQVFGGAVIIDLGVRQFERLSQTAALKNRCMRSFDCS